MRSALGVVLVLVLVSGLVGCGASRATGPAWPKMAESEIDGGESLDPRPGATAIAAAEPEDEVTVDAEAPAVEASAEPAEAGDNAADPTPMVFDDDTFSGEEIVIEIGDDD